MKPSIRTKMLISLVVSILFLSILEITARHYFPNRDTDTPVHSLQGPRFGGETMRTSQSRIWEHIPDAAAPDEHGVFSSINSTGFRDREIPREKPDKTVRLIVTGDSSIYGHRLRQKETFSEVLERTLNQAFPEFHFDVINTGVTGYSSVQSLILMDEYGFSFSPDIWIFANLWSDNNFDFFRDLEEIRRQNSALPVRHLLEKSALYRGIRYYATRRDVERWKKKLDRPMEFRRRRVPLPQYEKNLQTAVDRANSHNCKVVFLVLPQESDMGLWTIDNRWARGMGSDKEEKESYPWDDYRNMMRMMAQKSGFPVVEAPAAFARYWDMFATGLLLDPMHPNILGNRVLAHAVLSTLFEHPEVWPETFQPPPNSRVLLPAPDDELEYLTVYQAQS